MLYTRKLALGLLLELYYLVLWKSYQKEKKTQDLYLAIQHLQELISLLQKNHSDNSTANFKTIYIPSPMVKPINKLAAKTATKQPKQHQGQQANSSKK